MSRRLYPILVASRNQDPDSFLKIEFPSGCFWSSREILRILPPWFRNNFAAVAKFNQYRSVPFFDSSALLSILPLNFFCVQHYHWKGISRLTFFTSASFIFCNQAFSQARSVSILMVGMNSHTRPILPFCIVTYCMGRTGEKWCPLCLLTRAARIQRELFRADWSTVCGLRRFSSPLRNRVFSRWSIPGFYGKSSPVETRARPGFIDLSFRLQRSFPLIPYAFFSLPDARFPRSPNLSFCIILIKR